jgi:hypothetical protein
MDVAGIGNVHIFLKQSTITSITEYPLHLGNPRMKS